MTPITVAFLVGDGALLLLVMALLVLEMRSHGRTVPKRILQDPVVPD